MISPRPVVLIVDDDAALRETIKFGIGQSYEVSEASDGKKALQLLLKSPVDLVILDIRLPDTDGIALLKEIKRIDENLSVIMLTADTSVKMAVDAMKEGAYDFVTKPFDIDELSALCEKAIERSEMSKENKYLRSAVSPESDMIVGESPQIRSLISSIREIADSPSTVLIYGETGVGKELVARSIHRFSQRSRRLFVPVNCAAIPENLIESELFGHERGAFTGAFERHTGKFEIASGGTLFLDEIGTLPHSVQSKLLRVIQERSFERVGGEKSVSVDTRIISATNIDLKKAVSDGKFREDLFYRLNVIPVNVPPLRKRTGDIKVLALHFVKKYNSAFGKKLKGFDEGAMEMLEKYPWPGNVRELENLVERLVVLGRDGMITADKLPLEITGDSVFTADDLDDLSLREATAAFELDFIERVLKMAGNNKTKAAKMLGIHRNTLLQLEKKRKKK